MRTFLFGLLIFSWSLLYYLLLQIAVTVESPVLVVVFSVPAVVAAAFIPAAADRLEDYTLTG